MRYWIELIVTVACSVLASSGLWTFVQNRREKKNAGRQLMIAIAHDRIIHLGMKYVERGWITNDEFENLNDYLYDSYLKMNGNGSAKRVMDEVRQLPIRSAPIQEVKNDEQQGL